LARIFGVARQTVLRWLKELVQRLPDLKDTLLPPQADDVLELDGLWSFVCKKDAKRWLWLALCRRTRQIMAFVIGDRSEQTWRRLWHKIPDSYRTCHSFSDFWAAYQKVFSAATHQSVGKESGGTAHVERWNNTLRQRLVHRGRSLPRVVIARGRSPEAISGLSGWDCFGPNDGPRNDNPRRIYAIVY
jgi:IS1 family transposase